ncbi:unnamed protein product, partial [Amoebophrya sp. A25]
YIPEQVGPAGRIHAICELHQGYQYAESKQQITTAPEQGGTAERGSSYHHHVHAEDTTRSAVENLFLYRSRGEDRGASATSSIQELYDFTARYPAASSWTSVAESIVHDRAVEMANADVGMLRPDEWMWTKTEAEKLHELVSDFLEVDPVGKAAWRTAVGNNCMLDQMHLGWKALLRFHALADKFENHLRKKGMLGDCANWQQGDEYMDKMSGSRLRGTPDERRSHDESGHKKVKRNRKDQDEDNGFNFEGPTDPEFPFSGIDELNAPRKKREADDAEDTRSVAGQLRVYLEEGKDVFGALLPKRKPHKAMGFPSGDGGVSPSEPFWMRDSSSAGTSSTTTAKSTESTSSEVENTLNKLGDENTPLNYEEPRNKVEGVDELQLHEGRQHRTNHGGVGGKRGGGSGTSSGSGSGNSTQDGIRTTPEDVRPIPGDMRGNPPDEEIDGILIPFYINEHTVIAGMENETDLPDPFLLDSDYIEDMAAGASAHQQHGGRGGTATAAPTSSQAEDK